ncbi:MAG: hypothetical protein ABSC22_20135, partial [Roseiarcus sp.]
LGASGVSDKARGRAGDVAGQAKAAICPIAAPSGRGRDNERDFLRVGLAPDKFFPNVESLLIPFIHRSAAALPGRGRNRGSTICTRSLLPSAQQVVEITQSDRRRRGKARQNSAKRRGN